MLINNLAGIIMCKDTELCKFEIKDSMVTFEVLGEDPEYTPFEFIDGVNRKSITEFVNDRQLESGRQDLHRFSESFNMEYNPESFIHVMNGRAADDPCWIKFSTGGAQDYAELERRRLMPEEEYIRYMNEEVLADWYWPERIDK